MLLFNVTDSGVLVIVLNYTGDILNFGLAVESAKSDNVDVSDFFLSLSEKSWTHNLQLEFVVIKLLHYY